MRVRGRFINLCCSKVSRRKTSFSTSAIFSSALITDPCIQPLSVFVTVLRIKLSTDRGGDEG